MTVRLVWRAPEGEHIVDLMSYRDRILLATSGGLYEVLNGEVAEVLFVTADGLYAARRDSSLVNPVGVEPEKGQ